MQGEADLNTLLASMKPILHPETFVFACGSRGRNVDDLKPVMVFEESEGTTMILIRDVAETHGIDYQFPCRMITLNVHSSLEAVGFIAAVSKRLAEESIGVNPVSGYYHDHLFVPLMEAERAMAALVELSTR
jgi:hypothetical protein